MFEIAAWMIAVALAIHIGIILLVVSLAYAQGRNVGLWAFAAVITGPFALLIMWFWRGDEGAPGESKPMLGGHEDDKERRRHASRP